MTEPSRPASGGALRAAALALALAAAASGCYTGRLKYHYRDIPFVEDGETEDAVLEEDGQDAESAARQRRRLEQIAREDEAVYRMNAAMKKPATINR